MHTPVPLLAMTYEYERRLAANSPHRHVAPPRARRRAWWKANRLDRARNALRPVRAETAAGGLSQ
jgi:hypothetical protein